MRQAFSTQLDSHTICLAEAGHADIHFEDAAKGLEVGFSQELQADLTVQPLQPDEKQAVDELVRGKYATDAWTYRDLERETA